MALTKKEYFDRVQRISRRYNISITNTNFVDIGSTLSFWKSQYKDIRFKKKKIKLKNKRIANLKKGRDKRIKIVSQVHKLQDELKIERIPYNIGSTDFFLNILKDLTKKKRIENQKRLKRLRISEAKTIERSRVGVERNLRPNTIVYHFTGEEHKSRNDILIADYNDPLLVKNLIERLRSRGITNDVRVLFYINNRIRWSTAF